LCKQVAAVRLGKWPARLRALAALVRGHTVTEAVLGSGALWEVLRDWARQTRFDVALASSSGVAPYLVMEELPGLPAVAGLVDVDSQKWLDYAAASRGPAAWLYRREGVRLRRLERRLAATARAVTLVSEAEAALFRGFCPEGNVHAVTN